MMSEIEEASNHLLRVVEILKGFDKRLKNLEDNKVNIEGLNIDEIVEEVKQDIKDNLNYGEIADHINPSDVAEHINQADIVEEVANYYGAEGIAEHVYTDQVAEHVEVDYEKVVQGLIKSFMADKECK
tara:strand:- start:757 stop:1140 length:384 start_codon:yes stop_codon:yes gene_type:complete